ncbi:uncharacterized protein TNCV_819181 [Trichonephila clavipes]|nr:uncharacterized protein TNCV_819181 [Trichonephila clavipes]
MIACFVKDNHENWDRFLHEFAFALHTLVNETTNKTPDELFLGRKIITSFRKLINVTEDAEYVGRNIEKLFDEARQNMRKQNKNWKKYNRKRREVNIKATAVRPCPYYLRSRARQHEGFPEERRNIGMESIPQNNIRRRSLSMEALDGDPVDRNE